MKAFQTTVSDAALLFAASNCQVVVAEAEVSVDGPLWTGAADISFLIELGECRFSDTSHWLM